MVAAFSINTVGSPRRLATRDAETYWRRLIALGGTDINANDEVERILKCWMSFYEIVPFASWHSVWLLRSAQQMGSGATALEFRDRYTATLSNGPTWGSNGLDFTATTNARLLCLPAGAVTSNQLSIFAISEWLGPATETHHLCGFRSNTGSRYGINVYESNNGNTSAGADYTSTPAASQVRVSGVKTIAARFDHSIPSAALQSIVNGANSWVTTTATNDQTGNIYDAFHVGGGGPYNTASRTYKGRVLFVGLIKAYITQAQYDALRNTAKTTICSDLSLP